MQRRRSRRRSFQPNRRFRTPRVHRPSQDYAVVASTGTDNDYLVNTEPEIHLEYMPALFYRFPTAAEEIDWVSLRGAEIPSVPKRLIKSQHLFGENYIFLKQELLDFHTIPETDAKKLEFILAEPEVERAKTFVASGRAGDFHCLAIAKAAKELGKKAVIILRQAPMTTKQVRAVMAMMNLGARVYMRETPRGFQWTMGWQRFLSRFTRRVILDEAGACGSGALGYVSALCELEAQVKAGEIPEPDYLVVPVVSGTSLAGLELGKKLLGWDRLKIQGVATHCESQTLRKDMAEIANEASEVLAQALNKKPWVFSENDFFVDFSVVGLNPISDDIYRWLIRWNELELVDMDMERSGRALYGMAKWIEKRSLKNQKIVFWSISSPFRSGDLGNFQGYSAIPQKLKRWIREEQRLGRLMDIGKI